MGVFITRWCALAWRLCQAFWWTAVHSGLPIFFWVKPKWRLEDMPNLTGKVYLVTGGNSGVGYETCKALYKSGATVYLACRSQKRALQAIDDIRADKSWTVTGMRSAEGARPAPSHEKRGRLEFLELDLADLRSVERAAQDFKSREIRLDCLIANAGIMATPYGEYTKQGYTLQMGTNVIGHFLLIQLLLPMLQQSSRANPEDPSRLLCLSSAGHAAAPLNPDWTRFRRAPSQGRSDGRASESLPTGRQYEKWREYGLTKWAAIAITRRVHWEHGPRDAGFARPKRLVAQQSDREGEIVAVGIHPGMVATGLWNHLGAAQYILKHLLFTVGWYATPAFTGAINVLYAATCPPVQARKLGGEYIVPYCSVGVARPDTEDPRRVEQLWQWCEEQVGKAA